MAKKEKTIERDVGYKDRRHPNDIRLYVGLGVAISLMAVDGRGDAVSVGRS